MELGIAERAVKVMLFSFLLFFVIMAFIAFTYRYMTPYIPDKLDTDLTGHRFTNTCFAEDLLRKQPGVIDPVIFTQEKMDDCYDPQKPVRSYKIKLTYKETEKILASSNWKDGQFKSFTRRVLVRDNGLYLAKLFIAYRGP